MRNDTFYWHDYETFGANPKLDRPSQFAGIRTDLDLNEIGEPLELFCQPCEDVVPHPEACLITGITPQAAAQRGVPEPEFIARVLEQLGQPGTIGIGYNSIRFDDEITRHAAWRNFHPPYDREWRDGCSRWDLIDVARLCYALRPDGIQWPLREDGSPSFKLEDLAEANGLSKDRAHDAVSDVRTTIDLCKLIKTAQPRLFDYAFNNRSKQAARQMVDLRTHAPVLNVSSKFPAAQGCISLVMPLCEHPINKNQIIGYDLRHNPADLLALPPEDIHERLYTPAAELPEDIDRIALKGIVVNKAPVLVPTNTMSAAQAERVGLDLDQCRAHWKQLHDQIDAVIAKVKAVYLISEFESGGDPEQDLYGGFVSDADRKLCDQVLRTKPSDFAEFDLPFEDRRLHDLLFRYRARHYPDSLNEPEQDEWNTWRANRIEFAPDGGITVAELEAWTNAARDQKDVDQTIVGDLAAWAAQLRAHL